MFLEDLTLKGTKVSLTPIGIRSMLSQYITHLILLSLCSHFPTDTSLRIGLIVICYHLSLATYDAAGNLTLPVPKRVNCTGFSES